MIAEIRAKFDLVLYFFFKKKVQFSPNTNVPALSFTLFCCNAAREFAKIVTPLVIQLIVRIDQLKLTRS